jgi:hypothetical protein
MNKQIFWVGIICLVIGLSMLGFTFLLPVGATGILAMVTIAYIGGILALVGIVLTIIGVVKKGV